MTNHQLKTMPATMPALKPTEAKIQSMKTILKSYCFLGTLLLGIAASSSRADIISCGAISTNVGAKLTFWNGTNFASSSGYVQPLTFQRFTNHFTGVGGSYRYSGSNLLFQALSIKTNVPGAASLGSYLACRILSVTGPVGGTFSFWETIAGWPTYQFPVGGVYESNKSVFEIGNIELGAGSPNNDPYGFIPGRRFTADVAGDYFVTFQLIDISKNHPTDADAPVNLPSDPLTVKFSTMVDMNTTRFVRTNNIVTMSFKQSGLTNMYVEAASDLGGAWIPVAGPFTNAPIGTNITVLSITNSPGLTKIFYRLHGATP